MSERRASAQSVYVKDTVYLYCVAKPDIKFITKRIEWLAIGKAALASDSTEWSLCFSLLWSIRA